MQVAGRAVHTAELDYLREVFGGNACGLMAHQLIPGQAQQLRLALAFQTEPLVKGSAAVDTLGDVLLVEGVDQLIVHQHVLAARLVFQVLNLAHHLLVGRQEMPVRIPLPFDQRLADEHGARRIGVHAAIADAAVVVDHDAIERGALLRHHIGLLLRPVRIEQLFFQQMGTDFFQPLRLNRRNATAIQA